MICKCNANSTFFPISFLISSGFIRKREKKGVGKEEGKAGSRER